MKRPTDKYNDPGPRTLRVLLVRGGLLLVLAAVIGTLAGWTDRACRATRCGRIAGLGIAARRIGSLGDQLAAAQRRDGPDAAPARARQRRSSTNSAKYQIPADLAASIYDIALSEGIDPALGFQLVKIESSFKADARSSMDAIGYTQLQLATARFYEPGVTERTLMTTGRSNLRIGLPVPERPAGQVRPRHASGAAGLQPRPGQGGRHPGPGRRPDQRLFRRGARRATKRAELGRRRAGGRLRRSRQPGILRVAPARRASPARHPVRFPEGLDRDAVASRQARQAFPPAAPDGPAAPLRSVAPGAAEVVRHGAGAARRRAGGAPPGCRWPARTMPFSPSAFQRAQLARR